MTQQYLKILLIFFFGFGQTYHACGQKLSECLLNNAEYFLGTPYVAGTLDKNNTEQLVCRADGFDCVTFVDYVLGLSLYQLKYSGWNKSLEDNIQRLRYRKGIINGYGSRLHYFSEWILQNTTEPFLTEVTSKMGGIEMKKKINFITSNSQKYPLLISLMDKKKLAQSEYLLSQTRVYYIPKERVKDIEGQLKNGDIIAITTDVEGLDIVHTGFIKIINGQPHLLHASQTSQQVEVSKMSLSNYLMNNKKQNGIRVLRAQN